MPWSSCLRCVSCCGVAGVSWCVSIGADRKARSRSCSASRAPASASFVALERLGQQASTPRPVLEDVDDAHGGVRAFDAGLDQGELFGVAEPELVEPLGLGPADIARGGPARRIGILVMPDQGLPVLVSGPLHGFSDQRPGEGHRGSVPDAVSGARCGAGYAPESM